ncbi:MAG: hypothetical protein QXG38_00095 [Candidatus Hadarchaeales archaeon]
MSEVKKKHFSSLVDGILLTMARKHGTKILSGDIHFRRLKEAITMRKPRGAGAELKHFSAEL